MVRYFLIDKVTSLTVGQSATGVKCVSLSDEILHDHFPDYPTMPGALVIESMAQLSGFLLEMTLNRPGEPLVRALLGQIGGAKFYRASSPGDRMEVTVRIQSLLAGAAQVSGEVFVGEERAVRADLTFVLKKVDSERIHEQRRYVYKLWTRDFAPPLTIL
jgi:3-hydroxymyristoyl/3-hydroxydecanoyl-(acyl carrier protein) dehydratase